MVVSWEPGEFDRTFVVSGTLSVTTKSGEQVLGYPKPVSVSAEDQREAKTKVKMMLLSREGLADTNIISDALEVRLPPNP